MLIRLNVGHVLVSLTHYIISRRQQQSTEIRGEREEVCIFYQVKGEPESFIKSKGWNKRYIKDHRTVHSLIFSLHLKCIFSFIDLYIHSFNHSFNQ